MKLPEPRPKASTHVRDESIWGVANTIALPRDFQLPSAGLFDILDERRTRREFTSVNRRAVSALLWSCLRTIAVSQAKPHSMNKPVPTAGGLGCVRVVVVEDGAEPWLYEPRSHGAAALNGGIDRSRAILADARLFVGAEAGCLLLFMADRSFVESHYEMPDSLVLREAGGVQAVMALAAEALGLSFCPLGTLGTEWAMTLLGVGEQFIIPGGAALFGGR